MKILIIHPRFPGPFSHLAPALVQAGHTVMALTIKTATAKEWGGVRVVSFVLQRARARGGHPWLADLEHKTLVGEACMNAALGLKVEGLEPDVVLAHSGWGESLFIKDIWPDARLGICCEYFLPDTEGGLAAEPGEQDVARRVALRMQQLAQRLSFEQADQGMTPTRWQADSFPKPWRDCLTVVPDGVDTDTLVPNEGVSLTLNKQLVLTRKDQVITFACRELSAGVGFQVFVSALPDVLRRRPAAHVLIAGGDGRETVAVGGRAWRESLVTTLKSQLTEAEWARVHFVGALSHPQWVGLLQLSMVHVQLSYPSVVAAGLLEAMSVGCAIVGSRTAPLEAAIRDGETGSLVNFFDSQALADEVCRLLDAPEERIRLGLQAREFVRRNHDARTVCLAWQLAWVDGLTATQPEPVLGAAELRGNLQEILALL